MANADTVRRTISETLPGVEDLGNGILRGERCYDGKAFATAYFDLSDDVVERSRDIDNFQERLLGTDFFKADGDQRWNSYLYFWAGPNSQKNVDFSMAKARIEGNRHFARKFVLTEQDLLGRLVVVSARHPVADVSDDASARWADLLRAASLGVVLEQRPRTRLLELIANGEAFVAEASSIATPAPALADSLGTGLLRGFRVGQFRPSISGRSFSFGDVNLIFGQNGSGKTSLLESIEALYCGRIRRDPDAVFRDIEGDVLTPAGDLVKVNSTTSPAAIKARNLAWYGRPDQQSSAITHAFTRFNFLDTDAAFRLSSETNAEQIKFDLSRLLVGPETSTLWAYLTKVRDETMDQRRAADERLPALVKQTELLGNEVKRLQEMPTESTALAKTFRSSLRNLGATWTLGDEGAQINQSDRTRLESLSRGFRQALTVAQSASTTAQVLRDRSTVLTQTLSAIRRMAEEYSNAGVELAAHDVLVRERQTSLQILQNWAAYCEAGVPALAASLMRVQVEVATARSALAGQSADAIPELPTEYGARSVHDARAAAAANLDLAERQERSGVESLQQHERLGQSLAALQRDLREVVQSVIDRTGDSTHCPVCGTPHSHEELLRKIDVLAASEDPTLTDGLRQAIQVSKQQTEREREALASLKMLESYAISSSAPDSVTACDLREQMFAKHRELASLTNELERLESATDSLSRFGTDWAGYEEVRNAAASVVGSEEDTASSDVVNRHLASLRVDLKTAQVTISRLRESLTNLAGRAAQAVADAGIATNQGVAPVELIRPVERASSLLNVSLDFVQNAMQLINLAEDQSFESLQLLIDEAIEAFDRAQHAELSEVTARTDLSKKIEELHQATKLLRDVSARRENFAKASAVFSRIVQDHSLEKATKDALESIRGEVSDVFSRIHSPAEYVLGDFQDVALLVTREGNHARSVNQVSTGQRAALALSIFLALNRSAESAPPVMLIDDPVAHIDDLNALSFLDYLRDLAVGERKQIFFATADARLAALFQRKFEFLGDERFKKIVLTR
jgi:chromosome segregation protein